MKELREIETQDKFTILSEKKTKAGGSEMDVLVPWTQGGKININKRLYPTPLLQREVDRVQKAVESGAFIGTGDHPAGGLTDIATASHLVKKLWLDKGGRGWAQIKILDTERGKNIQSLIKGGAQLGISSRGFGNVKNGRVMDDYKLMGIDIVISPAEPTATFTKANIFESVNNFEDEGKVKKTGGREINKRAIENILKLIYSTKVSEFGYDGSYEDFAKKNRISATAKWLCQEYPAKFLTVEQALKYLGVVNKFGDEEKPITHYETTPQLAEEAFMMGITVEEYVKKLNEAAGHKGKADIPAQEAIEAGMAGSTKLVEKMLEYPDGVKRIAYVSEKVDVHERIEEARKTSLFPTEEEVLAKEAQRIFRIEKATNPETTETFDSIVEMLRAEKKRVQEEREALKKNRLAEQIKQSVAAGEVGVLREYKE